jgi:pyruvate dehydrogenase E2 component (dihydrolipoyllysine-residue acetyltransferase)
MDVLMPQLGETVSGGKILSWFKSVGEAVASGENLCEIETDKVTVEVPAIEGGFVRAINVEAGQTAAVGAVIAVIASTPENAVAPTTSASDPIVGIEVRVNSTSIKAPSLRKRELDLNREVRTPTTGYGPARLPNGVVASPLARRLASVRGIDLSRLIARDPSGRIKRADVERAAATGQPTPGGPLPNRPGSSVEVQRSRPHNVVSVDRMRAIIADRLTLAKTTIPHFYLAADVAVDRLAPLRREMNEGAERAGDSAPAFKLSINDFIIKAWSLALQAVPEANGIWMDGEILQFERSDVGVAVAVPGGVFSPVILSADTKSLSAISNEIKSLASRARQRSLQPAEYQGGTTSISNLGMHGVKAFAAIINPPHSTILAIGAAEKKAVDAPGGGVTLVGHITATLSCDHRVVDGVLGAALLRAFKSFLENPLRMVA